MKASDLITKLQKQIERVGDVPVWLYIKDKNETEYSITEITEVGVLLNRKDKKKYIDIGYIDKGE